MRTSPPLPPSQGTGVTTTLHYTIWSGEEAIIKGKGGREGGSSPYYSSPIASWVANQHTNTITTTLPPPLQFLLLLLLLYTNQDV